MDIKESQLVYRLAAREETALEEVVDRYGGLIKAIVRRHLSGLESHQDECVNDILFAVWNNIRQFDGTKSSLKNWIGAVSKYKSIDYKRKYFRELLQETADETIPDTRQVEETVLRKELDEEIAGLLKFLPKRDRKLFFDRYVLEREIPELSQELQVKPEVLYNRLSRGKKKIRMGISLQRSENHEEHI